MTDTWRVKRCIIMILFNNTASGEANVLYILLPRFRLLLDGEWFDCEFTRLQMWTLWLFRPTKFFPCTDNEYSAQYAVYNSKFDFSRVLLHRRSPSASRQECDCNVNEILWSVALNVNYFQWLVIGIGHTVGQRLLSSIMISHPRVALTTFLFRYTSECTIS